MNLPTKITITRIAMIPLLIILYCVYMATESKALCIVTALLYIATGTTDFIDGYLARKNNMVTTLGKFLDPIADKVLVLTGLAFIIEGNFMDGIPFAAMICAIVILARELIIGLFRQIAASKNFILAADVWGKIKTVLTLVAISTLMFVPVGGTFGEVVMWIGSILLIAATVITVYSGVHYIVSNKLLFKDNKAVKESPQADEEQKPQQ